MIESLVYRGVRNILDSILHVILQISMHGFESKFYIAELGLSSLNEKQFVDAIKSANVFPEIKIFPDPTDKDIDSVLFKVSFTKEHFESPFFTMIFRISGEGKIALEKEN